MATVLRAKCTWVRSILVPLPLLRYKKRKTVTEFCFARYLQPRDALCPPIGIISLGSQWYGAGMPWVCFSAWQKNFCCRAGGSVFGCLDHVQQLGSYKMPRQWALQSARNVRRNELCPAIVVVFCNPWQLRARACACPRLAGRVLIPCGNREPSAPIPLM